MNEQEYKIIRLLLNEMAFEGAAVHFHVQPPDIPEALYEEIVSIEIPQRYSPAGPEEARPREKL